MSVLLNITMPKICEVCPCNDDNWRCGATGEYFDYDDMSERRRDDCPLIELPPHGRLIDKDKFKADYSMKNDCTECEKELRGSNRSCEYDRIYSKMDFCGWLDDAEVVIEAEGSE